MGKILNAFFREELELGPSTDFDSNETKDARECAGRLEDAFMDMLNSDQRKLYDTLTDAQAHESYLYETERMILGYRLGVLMTPEVFTGTDELLMHREGN